jgi:aquaporin Z
MLNALRKHWPEYLIEAFCLGVFMVSAGVFTVLFEYPASPVHQAVGNPDLRRALIGSAMGLTAIGLIYSPWGQQSGAHMNPAVTLTFFRLGKVLKWDAVFYIAAQLIGGLLGVLLTRAMLGDRFANPAVNYIVTVPGAAGVAPAFACELLLSCGLMLMILFVTNTAKLARYTGIFAGTLVALFITIEAPYSGMSINPARTLASALPSGVWTAAWIYFVAPISGMFLAVEVRRWLLQERHVGCPKLNHHTKRRCIFCGFPGQK